MKSLDEFVTENLNVAGNPEAEIVVVCDTPSFPVYQAGKVMSKPAIDTFAAEARGAGFEGRDFFFVTCCPPIPEQDAATEGRINKFVDGYRDELMGVLKLLQSERKAKLLIYMGKTAARVIEGGPVKITKVRGRLRVVKDLPWPVLPLLSPQHVVKRPETAAVFRMDFQQLKSLRDCGFDVKQFGKVAPTNKFEWVTDLQFLLDNPPKALALDTETTGLEWASGAAPILATMCWQDQHAIAVPLDVRYWPEIGEKGIAKLRAQLKKLLANPKVAVTGHNLKFDIHCLQNIGIEVANWWGDSLQMAFAVDENMMSKNLADCVRRWVPEMAGYSDGFDEKVDKSKMLEVAREDMLPYACGDALATFILTKRLRKILQEDERQWGAYFKVQMPALRSFVDVENSGILVDKDALHKLGEALAVRERELYKKLIKQVPPAVKRRHLDAGSDLSFGCYDFTRDVLFSKDGFDLTPVVFTKGTEKLEKNEKVPSVSAKEHLPYFADVPFVHDLIRYSKLQKMRSTYVGMPSLPQFEKVALLKNGSLPKRLQSALSERGIEIGTGEVVIRGVKVRPRMRALELEDGKSMQYLHRIPLGKDRWLTVRKDGQLFEEWNSQASGFWPAIYSDGRLHPHYALHGTATGRSSSWGPSFQNIPKRGDLAKLFRKCFVPRKGYKFVEADLSQAELRIAAWMANETTMLKIYREGGDIHEATAAAVMGVKVEELQRMKGKDTPVPEQWRMGNFTGETVGEYYDFRRYQAKAVNFGFLFGMWWTKFKTYAKTDYGLDLTDAQAKGMREAFFRLYPKLELWHKNMKKFILENGYVRALHGALRRLPEGLMEDEKSQISAVLQGYNAPVQRFASDSALLGMCGFMEGCPLDDIKPVAFIHDSVISEVREDLVEQAAAGIKWHMENQPFTELFGITPPMPIVSDVSVGDNLAEMHGMKVKAAIPYWQK